MVVMFVKDWIDIDSARNSEPFSVFQILTCVIMQVVYRRR